MCKVKIGFRPQDDVRLVHAVREAVGDQMGVAVDANCAWDAATAIQVGRQLESAGVAWFEEPLPPGDLAGYREVRRALAIPVSGGESLAGPPAFRELIQSRAVDIVQPDVAVCGGISTLQRVQALADANGVRLLPHCWGSALSFAASLHYLATVPDGPPAVTPTEPLLEYDRSETPSVTRCCWTICARRGATCRCRRAGPGGDGRPRGAAPLRGVAVRSSVLHRPRCVP